MANTITKTTLVDGPRNLIQLINIAGDSSGDETNTVLVDRSAFTPDGTKLVVEKIDGHLSGFTARLIFDATTDLTFAHLPNGDRFHYDFTCAGGISSTKAGAGANGDVLLTTASLTTGVGTFVLYMRKD